VVATPIGNLRDITQRALDVLAQAHFVAAEDTRVTRGLLNHYGLGTRLVALHAHNEPQAARGVIEAIAAGRAVALVTDAGTPAISDPGHIVVEQVRAAGQRVIPVPGPSALTAALSASGLAFDGVVFAGFLPVKGAARRERLAALAAGPWAIALFEAPHRIAETLGDLHEALGERDVVIAREVTKRFETIERVPLAQARAWVEADEDRRRGEFVLVVEGREPAKDAGPDPGVVLDALLEHVPLKQAVALAVQLTGAPRNAVYAMALERKRR
jgi:16S rRNA (cytidine1402-2'-O)-methyltransferase